MTTISKSFSFDFGHRVWTQDVDNVLGCGRLNKCRHLHGHRGTVQVYLTGEVQSDGMVTDFAHLNWFKVFLDEHLDHKMILDMNDPLLENYGFKYDEIMEAQTLNGFWFPDKSLELDEIQEGIVLMKTVPTAENFTKTFYDLISKKMNTLPNLKISRVDFWETPNSLATYTG